MHYAFLDDLDEEKDGIILTFEGLPGATHGKTRAEALTHAQDLLVTALSILFEDGKAIPSPKATHGRPLAFVPALAAAKLALHEAMLDAEVSNVELARRLGIDEKAVRRLRNPLHRRHIGQVEAALHELGKRLDVTVRDAA